VGGGEFNPPWGGGGGPGAKRGRGKSPSLETKPTPGFKIPTHIVQFGWGANKKEQKKGILREKGEAAHSKNQKRTYLGTKKKNRQLKRTLGFSPSITKKKNQFIFRAGIGGKEGFGCPKTTGPLKTI